MPKVVLSIFETDSERGKVYRALMQKGENPQPASRGKIIYQDGKEIKTTGIQGIRDAREAIRKLQKRARKWADGQGIKFIHNIDINSYD